MSRSLTCVVCVAILAGFLTYLSATACDNSAERSDTSAVADVSCEGKALQLAKCDATADEGASGMDRLKSSILAGRAVGKAMVRTAVVLASSMACAARHAASALAVKAYSIV
jgi:hypothetical protein